MRHVATKLLSKQDPISKKEGEKLERLCLTHDEKMQVISTNNYLFIPNILTYKFIFFKKNSFVQEIVKLLEPFEAMTRRLSGGKYPTLNMVHPYMCTLKRMFAPRAN